MPYCLHFYSLQPRLGTIPNRDPDSVATFIEQRGRSVGELVFRAAECMLFFQAIEDLLGVEATRLYSAPLFGVEPDEEDPIFGGLSRPETERLIAELDTLLRTPEGKMKNGLSPIETAKSMTLDPDLFLNRLRDLRRLLLESLIEGGQPLTLYS
jgi:hypothetical protein